MYECEFVWVLLHTCEDFTLAILCTHPLSPYACGLMNPVGGTGVRGRVMASSASGASLYRDRTDSGDGVCFTACVY